jgi:hypothetical protein
MPKLSKTYNEKYEKLRKKLNEFLNRRLMNIKECILYFRTQPKDANLPNGEMITVANNLCLQDEKNAQNFKDNFSDLYSKYIIETENLFEIQNLLDVEPNSFQYYDTNFPSEIANSEVKFDSEGVLISKNSDKKYTSVRRSFRYDSLVDCKSIPFKGISKRIHESVKKVIKPESCCVAYAVAWEGIVKPVAFCSLSQTQCQVQIRLLQASMYKKCFETNLTRLTAAIQKTGGDVDKANLPVNDAALLLNLLKNVNSNSSLNSIDPNSPLGSAIQYAKENSNIIKNTLIAGLMDKLNGDPTKDGSKSLFGYDPNRPDSNNGVNGPNGKGGNGTGANGMGPNGTGANGMGPNGTGANGMGPNGTGANGMGPNGTGPNGMGPNGTGPNGMGPNGKGGNGTGANGTGPNGKGANGTGANGTGPNGMGPNGKGANGSGSSGPNTNTKNGNNGQNASNNTGKNGASGSNDNSNKGSNNSQDILKDMFKDDFKNLQKEMAKNPEKFANMKQQKLVDIPKTTKEGLSPQQKAENDKAVKLAENLAKDLKNSFNGAKLSPEDIKKLSSLIAENPKVFEEMKKNNIPIDMSTLEKLRNSSPGDAGKMMQSMMTNKSLKIESTTTKSTRCPGNGEDNDPNNSQQAIASDTIPSKQLNSMNPPSLTSDTNPNFNSDDDFNNLNISCGPKEDMNEEKASDDPKNKVAKKIYIIIPMPAKLKDSGIQRSLDSNSLPKPPGLHENIELSQKGNTVYLPNGKAIATVNGISTGVNINDPEVKKALIANPPANPNDPKSGKKLLDNIDKALENAIDATSPSEKELEKWKITVNLVGSWLRKPTEEEAKKNYIQEFILKKETARDLINKIKKLNDSLV